MIEETAKETLPVSGGASNFHNKPKIVGWNSEIKEFKEMARFWHAVWISCGKLVNTQVHKIMKKTRNVYHYQIRKCRKAEEKIKKNKFLDMCLNGEADMFTEIKKLRKAPEPVSNILMVKKRIYQVILQIFIVNYIIPLMILLSLRKLMRISRTTLTSHIYMM